MKNFLVLVVIFLTGCHSGYYQFVDYDQISCLSLVDRDGFTTTVQTKERLDQYAGVDFLTPQSYQKVMCIYRRDNSGNVPAFVTSYYPNGQVCQYLELVNARAQGCYQEWHENGRLKVSGQIIGGEGDLTDAAAKTWIFDGCCQAWTNTGQLEATIQYQLGALEGESIYYHANGQVKKRISHRQNIVEGTSETYNDCGTLVERANYRQGLRDGISERFNDSGDLIAEESYSAGRLLNASYYNDQGQVVAKIENGHGYQAQLENGVVRQLFEFRNGLPEGEVKLYDQEGRLVNRLHVKNGKKHGEELVYYPAPVGTQVLQPKLSIMWFDDKIHGLVKSWYADGTMESQRELSNNVRNGLATAWYRNGSVMLMEEYDHDKLVKGEYFKRGERRPESKIADGTGIATLYDADGNLAQKVHYYHSHILD